MKEISWTIYALLCIMLCHAVFSSPLVKRQIDLTEYSDLNPTYQEEHFGDETDRDKRKIGLAKFGIKSAVLGLIFGKINNIIDAKTKLIDTLDQQNIAKNKAYGIEAPKNGLASIGGVINSVKYGSHGTATTTPSGPTTTDDTPDFDRQKVSLEIPDELFGSSFELVTTISKIVSDVIMGTAERTQKLLQSVQPFFGKVLTLKGFDVSTQKESASSSSNSIK